MLLKSFIIFILKKITFETLNSREMATYNDEVGETRQDQVFDQFASDASGSHHQSLARLGTGTVIRQWHDDDDQGIIKKRIIDKECTTIAGANGENCKKRPGPPVEKKRPFFKIFKIWSVPDEWRRRY